jgi:hypothetical protein
VRGLPPDPPNTARLETAVDVNGWPVTFAFSFFNASFDLMGPTELHEVLNNWIIFVGAAVGGSMHSGAQLTTCRLFSLRTSGPRALATFPTNRGAWEGGQANHVAVGLYVRTTAYGRGSGSRVRLPACPDAFIDNNREVSATARGRLLAIANGLANFQNAPIGGVLTPTVLGTIQRQASGRPLSSATFAPATSVEACRRVETLRRRLPERGQLSPL